MSASLGSFEDNQISDIPPLAGLTGLGYLYLSYNQVSDIYPLVENPGLNSGDQVTLRNNPLSSTSCTVYIPELISRGVFVDYSCP
jgi:Leucine-rich repeat (LRR) protein